MTRWPPPPSLSASFFKAHGLGNDYLVFEAGSDWIATPEAVRRVCDRTTGVGSDGVVALLDRPEPDLYRSRMFNPDGSEFERSGNGLRILGAHIHRTRDGHRAFDVAVGGSRVSLEIHGRSGPAYDVSVEMGRATTGAAAIELGADALNRDGTLTGPDGDPLAVTPVSVGNPHLVVFRDPPTEDELARVGPFLTAHPALRHGSNVQLASSPEGRSVRALIWERGVGRTSASGTSACAVAVASVARGRLSPGPVTVVMPGGTLQVTVSEQLDVVLRGPVEEVFTGSLTEAAAAALGGSGVRPEV